MFCSFSFNSVAFGDTGRDYVERSIKEIHIIMIKLMAVPNLDMHDYYVIVHYMRSQLTIPV